MLIGISCSIFETSFVETTKIRKMNLQPLESVFTQWFPIIKLQEPPRKVVSNVVQIWRDWVSTASEINVMRKVEFVMQELFQVSGCPDRLRKEMGKTHSSRDLNFEVHTTSL